jgi:hypothetical protein
MTRELLSVRHGMTVVGGAAVIWLVEKAALPLLGQVPSYPALIAEWQGTRPPTSAVGWAVLFLVVAAILSVTEEVRRDGGLRMAIKMAVGCGLIAYIARAWTTPSHLQGVVATIAAARGIGMVAAVAIMHVAKRRWLTHGDPVEPGLG